MSSERKICKKTLKLSNFFQGFATYDHDAFVFLSGRSNLGAQENPKQDHFHVSFWGYDYIMGWEGKNYQIPRIFFKKIFPVITFGILFRSLSLFSMFFFFESFLGAEYQKWRHERFLSRQMSGRGGRVNSCIKSGRLENGVRAVFIRLRRQSSSPRAFQMNFHILRYFHRSQGLVAVNKSCKTKTIPKNILQ